MEYKIKLTDHATQQMQEAVRYISKTFLAPDVARRWAKRVKKEIASLGSMPRQFLGP